MSAGWHATIPSTLLFAEATSGLRSWLKNRGLSMTLLELDQERRRRKKEGTTR